MSENLRFEGSTRQDLRNHVKGVPCANVRTTNVEEEQRLRVQWLGKVEKLGLGVG